jgi:hypothetical protein
MEKNKDKERKPSGLKERLDTVLKNKRYEEEAKKSSFPQIKYEKPPHY